MFLEEVAVRSELVNDVGSLSDKNLHVWGSSKPSLHERSVSRAKIDNSRDVAQVNLEELSGMSVYDANESAAFVDKMRHTENAPLSGVFGIDWNHCLASVSQKVEPHLFEAYLSELVLDSLCPETKVAVIFAPNAFVCRAVIRDYLPLLKNSLSAVVPYEVDVQIKVASTQTEKTPVTSVAPLVVLTRDRPQNDKPQLDKTENVSFQSSGIPINPRYNFESYVVGNNNHFCHAAAQRVGQEPGASYNPLFIYGGVGLGKTHLLHAIGNKVLENNPSARVLYLSSEAFMNELIAALRTGETAAFRDRMRSINLLLIDDIQFLSGKEGTQEEFFHTFNALYNAKNQIVITSDKMPQEIVGIEERLRTRFAWGLTADLQSPDFETRVAILNRKATVDGYDLPEEVAHFIADNISSNVRELEGALTRLHAMSSLQGQTISLSLAESALKQLIKPKTVNVTIDDIKTAVALHFKMKVSDLSSKQRTRNLSFARHIAMYLCRTHTTASYPEIGGQFGGRDHSSVINGANKVAKTLSSDTATKEVVKNIEERLALK
jgi:chromosomal replication initiator protein